MAKDKAGLALILGLGKKPKGDDDGEGTGYDEGLDAAAEEILDAVEAKDAGALKDALKSFVALCRDDDGEE